MTTYKNITSFIRTVFHEPYAFIPLHDPRFLGNEKKYLNECIDSNFVSSVGKFVGQFEECAPNYTGAKYAVAAMNGTAALHIALQLAGVQREDEVTHPGIHVYCHGKRHFIHRRPSCFFRCRQGNTGTFAVQPLKHGFNKTPNFAK